MPDPVIREVLDGEDEPVGVSVVEVGDGVSGEASVHRQGAGLGVVAFRLAEHSVTAAALGTQAPDREHRGQRLSRGIVRSDERCGDVFGRGQLARRGQVLARLREDHAGMAGVGLHTLDLPTPEEEVGGGGIRPPAQVVRRGQLRPSPAPPFTA
ncbi:MAG: hypothetical protein ACQSGP_25725 [Frankia sp.]